jgi:hypothetical protein
MVYLGTVQGKVVVLDKGAKIKDGLRVVVELVPMPSRRSVARKKGQTFADRYKKFIGATAGPADLARNHDHYAHGAPKRK